MCKFGSTVPGLKTVEGGSPLLWLVAGTRGTPSLTCLLNSLGWDQDDFVCVGLVAIAFRGTPEFVLLSV